jgi:hydroxypyruvate isomerase
MPRFSANISLMYTEYPVAERFEQAAASGFRAVEFLYPQDDDRAAMRAALDRTGLTLLQINAPRARGNDGRVGANDPRRRDEYRTDMDRSFEMAAFLGAAQMHCTSGATLPDVDVDVQWGTLVENMVWVAERAATFGITPMIEPLNTYDNPGYMVPTTKIAMQLVEAAGQPNLRLQYDLYHSQRMEGNHTDNLTNLLPHIANIQVSETPGRRALGDGELNLPYFFRLLDRLGYAGWVGVGYLTDPPTDDSLAWLRASGFWDR